MKTCVEKIVYPGNSLSRYKKKVVFTNEGLPGEILEVTPLKTKKDFIEARINNILKTSNHRQNPKCGHYRICSPYQYIKYPFQIKLKKDQLEELLINNLNIAPQDIKTVTSPRPWRYRNKIHLHILWKDKKPALAYHIPGTSKKFQEISDCMLISEQISYLLKNIPLLLEQNKFYLVKEITIRQARGGQQLYLTLFTPDFKKLTGFTKLFIELKKKYHLRGMTLIAEKKPKIRYWGKKYIEEKFNSKRLRIGPQSFFQINPSIFKIFVKNLKKDLPWSKYKNIIDLYCGIGTLGILLGKKDSFITGIEENKNNIPYLIENIRLNKMKHFKPICGKAENLLPKLLNKKTDLLIIDPPRKGVKKDLAKQILRKPPATIIYLSCNPSTAIRDLKLLLTKYKLKQTTMYDFFPQTPHIEFLTILEKQT